MKLARYVDRQFWASVGWTIAFYFTVVPALIVAAWFAQEWAALAFFAFLAWAYRWPIGAKLGWCARRPGARDPA